MVRYDMYCDTGITIRYVSRYIYYPLIYEMQNCVIKVPIRIYYNIGGNTYHDTIFSLVIRIVGAVYRYIVIHWWIVTSLTIWSYLDDGNNYNGMMASIYWDGLRWSYKLSVSTVILTEPDKMASFSWIVPQQDLRKTVLISISLNMCSLQNPLFFIISIWKNPLFSLTWHCLSWSLYYFIEYWVCCEKMT